MPIVGIKDIIMTAIFLLYYVFQSLFSSLMNLLTQEPSRQRLRSFRQGIPKPPNYFFMQIICQLAKCNFLSPS
jgi:hypothetical protein